MYDMIIIGAGPGGYEMAERAGHQGQKVLLVEKEHLGGVCLNWGCIPTKALLQSAEVLETARHAKAFGIKLDAPELDFPAVHKFKTKTVRSNAKGVEYLFKKNGVTVLAGRGRMAPPTA